MKTIHNFSNQDTAAGRKNDPQRNDPTKQDERDNDPTRIRPDVNEPDKNDPTVPEEPGRKMPRPGGQAENDSDERPAKVNGFMGDRDK